MNNVAFAEEREREERMEEKIVDERGKEREQRRLSIFFYWVNQKNVGLLVDCGVEFSHPMVMNKIFP